jgi:hypothetical protein
MTRPRPTFTPVGLLSGRRLVVAVVLNALVPGPLRAQATVASGEGKKVLYVNRSASKADAIDKKVMKQLKLLGFAVNPAQQAGASPGAEAADLIVISSGYSGKATKGAYKDAAVPVVLWEAAILADMGMTSSREGEDWGESTIQGEPSLTIVDATHPLAAGLPKGLLKPFDGAVKLLNWGKPGPAAAIVATLHGAPSKAAIFAYEKGALMDRGVRAPARRVMLFLNDDSFEQLNETGVKLFDAAMLWAVGNPSK